MRDKITYIAFWCIAISSESFFFFLHYYLNIYRFLTTKVISQRFLQIHILHTDSLIYNNLQ